MPSTVSETGRTSRPANRGRRAAESNRSALVAAARAVFADVGLDAPLSAVARTAGVGQGSLYRHFPTRADLALAVFEDNVGELEALADDPVTTLDDLLSLLTRQAVGSVAFVDMVTSSAEDPRPAMVVERVTTARAGKLHHA